jgi:hypothetical protein
MSRYLHEAHQHVTGAPMQSGAKQPFARRAVEFSPYGNCGLIADQPRVENHLIDETKPVSKTRRKTLAREERNAHNLEKGTRDLGQAEAALRDEISTHHEPHGAT